ncbi:MAG: phosphatidylserine decarboxylase [Gemmataceae bacterium]|nr:phosphatidylserine decarboxylase [Gemmataceae bacterium]
MSVAAPPSFDLPKPESPTSVQPGGFGIFVRLELAWGSVRRAILSHFCKAHCQRWRSKLQGGTPDLSDVVDSRDLKFFRNVSPFWVNRAEDDYYSRESLGFARYGFAELVGFSVTLGSLFLAISITAVLITPWMLIPSTAVVFLWLEVLWFFRDPERVIPEDPRAVLSPADGTVTHVETVDEPGLGPGTLRISIFLSVFNVHGNRVPLNARFREAQYFRGRYLDARHPDCSKQNEQLWADFTGSNNLEFRVKQISGAIARRIVCFARPGEDFRAGDRYGMIKFGSRTEFLCPANRVKDVLVKPGDKVRGGVSVLGRLA